MSVNWRSDAGQLLLGTVPVLLCAGIYALFLEDVVYRYPFFCFLPPILIAARFGGFLGGVVATVVATVLLNRIWLTHRGQVVVSAQATVVAQALFVGFGFMIALVHRQLHEALKREAIIASREREANRAKDEFLATLSHELRTPMNVVLGYARMLKSHVGALPGEQRPHAEKALDVLDRNARAQMRLVEDLLDMQRIVSGRFHIERGEFDLQGLGHAVAESLRLQAEAKKLHWVVKIAPIRMWGDGPRIQQVLWNLLANAIKFTPPGGCIGLYAAREDDTVTIRIQDSGEGIPAHFLPHVFERFRQLDSSNTRRHFGMGLGLTIVKEVVDQHGGSITAESEGEGKGATFTVRLPVGSAGGTVRDGGDATSGGRAAIAGYQSDLGETPAG